jgi:hypothetical protein
LNGSSVTQIDTTSLNHNFYFTAPYMTGDGNTVALYKRFGSTGAFRPQIVKFTSTGIEWSEFLQLPMNYDGLDELASPGHHPSGLALEEGKGLFVTYPGSSEPFVLAYKYSGSRYRPAGVFRVGLNHVFPTSGRFAESVAFNGTDLFIGDTGYVTTPGGPIYCTNPGTVGYIKVMQPLATNIGGPDGSTKLQPWLTSTISDLGAFVATDGTYALGGSAWDQDAHNTWGEVTLFQNLGGGAWEHVERFIDGWSGWEGKSGWGAFGTSADINNDFLVIGAPNAVSGWDEVRSGAVYIARKVNGVFEAGPVLTPEYGIPGTPVGSYFGHAVALTGNTLAIGTPDWNNPPSRGSVWIYNYNGTNDWISNEVLGPNVASGQDWEAFGYAVDASGNNLIVGIPYRSSNGRTYAGAIQIFRRNTTTGFYTSMLEANAPSSWPAFSYHGATVSIGADWAAAAGGTGSVVIYRRSTTTGAWTQNTVITPNPAQNGFGYSVAIEGTRLVVGSPFENKVHRYERAFNGTWPWGGSITGPGGSTGFGASVAFRNGNVAIGDHSATSGTASSNTGAVYFTSFTGI